jgi:hypothetical protein
LTANNPRSAIPSTLAFVGALALAGCGGGSSSTASNGATSTAARSRGSGGQPTVTTADAICARRNRELAAVTDTGADQPTQASAARKRATVERRALGELEKLTPPAGIAARYRDLVEVDRAELQRIVELGDRVQGGNTASARLAVPGANGGNLRLLVLAARTGLRDCSTIG